MAAMVIDRITCIFCKIASFSHLWQSIIEVMKRDKRSAGFCSNAPISADRSGLSGSAGKSPFPHLENGMTDQRGYAVR